MSPTATAQVRPSRSRNPDTDSSPAAQRKGRARWVAPFCFASPPIPDAIRRSCVPALYADLCACTLHEVDRRDSVRDADGARSVPAGDSARNADGDSARGSAGSRWCQCIDAAGAGSAARPPSREEARDRERPTFITRRVAWSSDGRAIYASVGEGDSDVVLFEGLQP